MKQIIDFLKGKKTYIVAILGGVAFILYQLGYVDGETFKWICGMLGITLPMTLHAAISRKKTG